jgi:ribosomal-protein-alanine N-acetyltransferase
MNLKKSGRKISIRPLELSDFETWKKSKILLSKKAKNRWDNIQKLTKLPTKSDFKKVLREQSKNINDDYFYDFGVFLKDGTLIGRVSIMDVSRGLFQNAYLGYRIFSDYWGNGYGKEAALLAIKVAFHELNIHRIEAGIEPANKRSIALAKSIGLKKEGHSPKRLFLNEQWVGLSLFVIHSEDLGITWKKKK